MHTDTARLEGLCEPPTRNRVVRGLGSAGIERIEAHLLGQAFTPHRHDTYAIGITLSGVQTFRYRGARWYCLPGQWHVLHPDETHDGGAGTEAGFSYRIIYIDPSLIQAALGGKKLPFVADPVVSLREMPKDLPVYVHHLHEQIDDLGRTEIAIAVADLLGCASASVGAGCSSLDLRALIRVRDLIVANPTTQHSAAALEAASGLDRWTIARQFRAAFGTSPRRFRTMRQLEAARRLMQCGQSLATAALGAGFADQSHMSRMFKCAYGMTPAKWLASLEPCTSPT